MGSGVDVVVAVTRGVAVEVAVGDEVEGVAVGVDVAVAAAFVVGVAVGVDEAVALPGCEGQAELLGQPPTVLR